MRHLKKKYRLAGGKDERRALLKGLAITLIKHKHLTTTIVKAKALKAYFDKLVTLAKKNDLHHKRLLISRLGNNKKAAFKLINEILPNLGNKVSGFTTFRRLNPRKGDNTLLAEVKILEKAITKKETVSQKKVTQKIEKKTSQVKAEKKNKVVKKEKKTAPNSVKREVKKGKEEKKKETKK